MNKVIDKGFRSCRFVSTIVKHPGISKNQRWWKSEIVFLNHWALLFVGQRIAISVGRTMRSLENNHSLKAPYIIKSENVWNESQKMGFVFHKLHITSDVPESFIFTFTEKIVLLSYDLRIANTVSNITVQHALGQEFLTIFAKDHISCYTIVRTFYVTWLCRDMLHSAKSTSFS